MYANDTDIVSFQEFLLGHSKNFFIKPATLSDEVREKKAYNILKWIFESILHWSPQEAADHFSKKEYDTFRLKEIFKYISTPISVPYDDYRYYVSQIYPEIPYNTRENVIRVWDDVKAGRKPRFNKTFFKGPEGEERRDIILESFIQRYVPARNLEELYEKFANSSEINKLLKEQKLYDSFKKTYTYPVELLHRFLQNREDADDEFLFITYMYYNIGKFDKLKKNQKKKTKRE